MGLGFGAWMYTFATVQQTRTVKLEVYIHDQVWWLSVNENKITTEYASHRDYFENESNL